ncbi:MAG TPA: response regulator [Terracidiphilus sp.]|nr:response regulator [Terracidiphilus sp.]
MSGIQTLPVVPADHGSKAVSSGTRPRVLVVDDESVIADTLTEILSRSGYAAMAAYDGTGALESALLAPPALLISDVVLPGMSGIELAIQMRRIYPDCKTLLFSGQASTSDMLAAAHRDGHEFTLLTKPVHPKDLLAWVGQSLRPNNTVRSDFSH